MPVFNAESHQIECAKEMIMEREMDGEPHF